MDDDLQQHYSGTMSIAVTAPGDLGVTGTISVVACVHCGAIVDVGKAGDHFDMHASMLSVETSEFAK